MAVLPVNHVANHPRWDETTDEPIGVGTVIKRRVTRFEKVTEGTMEVTEFEPETVMRVSTQDGPMTIEGFAMDPREIPEFAVVTSRASTKSTTQIRSMMETSVANSRH